MEDVKVDLHTHVPRDADGSELERTLAGQATGLAKNTRMPGALLYEDAVDMPGVEEVEQGRIARLRGENGVGYLVRAEEIGSPHYSRNIPHLLAVGCEGDYLGDSDDPYETVSEIHNRGGIAILNHPSIVDSGNQLLQLKLIDPRKDETMTRLAEMTDGVEGGNAYQTNVIPDFLSQRLGNYFLERELDSNLLGLVLSQFIMHEGIEWQKQLATQSGKKWMAASDSHLVLEHVGVAGNYMEEESLQSVEDLRGTIREGRFEQEEAYLDFSEMAKGIVPVMLENLYK